MQIWIIYLLIINAAAFALMGIDKYRAKHHRWRISERTLFISALLGGSPGAILGMHTFRHKTQHLTFTVGMPLIFIAQLLLFFFIVLRAKGLLTI